MTPDLDPLGLVGQVLDGQFRVERFVGEGGFSLVYRGHNVGLDEPCALKFLKVSDDLPESVQASFFARFRDEGRIQYRLSQGNLHIARSIAAGTAFAPKPGRTVPFYVLEWLDGRTLAAELEVRRAGGASGVPLDLAVAILDSAADAIAYAHSQGVVHRDLNPGNFFFVDTNQGRTLKVIDFGVAKLMDDQNLDFKPRAQTLAGIRVFAPAYGAPEQFDAGLGGAGPWTDVYAFAIVLLEVLRDKPVFEAASIAEFAVRTCDRQNRPTPRALGLFAPPEIEQVFQRALSVSPQERYAELGLFWEALRAAIRAAKAGAPRAAEAVRAPDASEIATREGASTPPARPSLFPPRPDGSRPMPPRPTPRASDPPRASNAPPRASVPPAEQAGRRIAPQPPVEYQEPSGIRTQSGAAALAAAPVQPAPDLLLQTVRDLSPFAGHEPPPAAKASTAPMMSPGGREVVLPAHLQAMAEAPVDGPEAPVDGRTVLDPQRPQPASEMIAADPHAPPVPHVPQELGLPSIVVAPSEPPPAPAVVSNTLVFGSGATIERPPFEVPPHLLEPAPAKIETGQLRRLEAGDAHARLRQTMQISRADLPKEKAPVPGTPHGMRPDGRPAKASEVMVLGSGASLSQFVSKEARADAAARIAGDGKFAGAPPDTSLSPLTKIVLTMAVFTLVVLAVVVLYFALRA